MEFKMLAPAKEQDLSQVLIQFNNEELKKNITEQIKKYQGIVYSENNIGEAKGDRAKLNKFKEALESKRKIVKAEYLKPYMAFEAQVKELTALIDEPILVIDTQVKEYEGEVREAKRKEIETIYKEAIGSLDNLLPLEKLWNDRWLNVTFKIKDIEKEITETVERVQDGLALIIDLGSEFEPQIRDKYIQTLDITTALKEKARLEEQKAKLEEYRVRQEIQNRAVEVKKEQDEVVVEEAKEVAQTPPIVPQVDTPAPLERLEFVCFVDKHQKQLLREFFITNKIKIGKVER